MTPPDRADGTTPQAWPSEAETDHVVDILIVDDKPANIVSLEAILAREDYNLVPATSGMEALKHILKRDFAVILLDVMMPEMDGFEFARLVKQRMRSTRTPIIFLTAIATDFRYLQEGYQVGAVDYLQKPLDSSIVRAKVAVFVDLFRKNERIRRQEALLREIQRVEQERHLDEVKSASERHYRMLAETLPQIIFTTDAAGNVRYFNRKWTQYTGLPEEHALSEEARRQVIHPDDLGVYEESWNSSRATGLPTEVEMRFREAATGSYRWHLCRAVPERNPKDNAVIGWIGTITDIHGQKRAEHAQRFLAEASTLLSSSHDYARTLPELCGKLSTACGDGCVISLTLSGRCEFRHAAGSAVGSDFTLQDIAPSQVVKVPIHIRGQVAGSLACVRCCAVEPLDRMDLDLVTETCRHLAISVENALLYEEAQEANRQKEEFLAILSHELRTPLNAVLGWTSIVKQEISEPRLAQGLEVVETNAKLLSQLVADLLDVSRIVTGKLELNRAAVDLRSLVANILATVRPFADEKRIKIFFDASSEATLMVLGDRSRLQQILWNLLTNAIKFTPEKGSVRLNLVRAGGRAHVTVADDGVGISAELLPAVFDRFRQADSSSTRRHGGLGLGLAIVKHLVELHGGSVMASSQGLGCGSAFTVDLPLADENELRRGAESTRGLRSAKGTRLGGRSVVLVDDDPSSRMLVAIFLRQAGAEVRTAASVREAMAFVRERGPDLVVTDIGMPGEDGYELLRQIGLTHKGRTPSPQTVALTAYASVEDAERASRAGFSLYLTKPIESGDLISSLVHLLALNESRGKESELPGETP